ncbi:arrestin domain-containing protein 3 [Plakobranchus ocellatus]|uniref:Arrestin domain-containing protein 3 n=1 Tax=Plakobranchus ocellatus TaxID=259542 RepID=A0AAV4E290_9GAST|nr:arrestin domain-containing protein 3 [Plakobranchus ocellatus]
MGKLSTFKIVFSRNKDKYQPGDVVEGHVAIEIKDGIKVKGIYLECVGEASVGWSESQPTNSDKNRRNHIRYYKANETYFKYERELMKRTTERRGSISVGEGSYMYPFSFRLPPHIPSSFEGPLGHVRYWVTGTVEKNWGSDHVSRVDLTVTNPLDLNLEKDAPLLYERDSSNLQVSQTDSAEAILCCLCCRTGPITCVFSLDRAGYVPGEFIHVLGEIVNTSSRKIGSTSARLLMHSEYTAESKTKSHTECISEVKRGSIKPGGRDRWEGDALLVPTTPTSYLKGCSIINVSYWVELVVHPSGPAFNLKVPLKVIIGTIPMRKPGEPTPGPSGLMYPLKPHLAGFSALPRKSLPATAFCREHLPNVLNNYMTSLYFSLHTKHAHVAENPEEAAKTSPTLEFQGKRGEIRDSLSSNSKSNLIKTNGASGSSLPITSSQTSNHADHIMGRYGRSKRRVSSHQ